MRIGIDYRPVTISPYSGIGRQVLAMEEVLRARPRTTLELFSACPPGHPHRDIAHCPDSAIPVYRLHRPLPRWRFESQFLPAEVADLGLDLYIATANAGLPFGHKPANARYALLLHDVFQLTLDNRHRSWMTALAYRNLDRFAIGHSVKVADAIWTPSRYTASEVARLFPEHSAKLRVLPNCVSFHNGAAPPPELAAALPEGRYWLLVGTWEPRKNTTFFLDCLADARAHAVNGTEFPEVVIVGSPEDLAERHRHTPGVRFLNRLDDHSLQALYARAECFWHPAYAEGFGLPVVEALRNGTPVAVAHGSALDEVTPPGAVRFDPEDHEEVAALILELAAKPPARDPERWREWAEHFGPEPYAQRLNNLLHELAA